jgi:hypothetical protein
MCWKLVNFASLFDYGFNFVLASGIVQEFFLTKKFGIAALNNKLNDITATISLSAEQQMKLDAISEELDVNKDEASAKLVDALLACRIILGLGLLLPTLFIGIIGFDLSEKGIVLPCDPGIAVFLPVFISLIWGPVTATTFAYIAHSVCTPIERNYRHQIEQILKNCL